MTFSVNTNSRKIKWNQYNFVFESADGGFDSIFKLEDDGTGFSLDENDSNSWRHSLAGKTGSVLGKAARWITDKINPKQTRKQTWGSQLDGVPSTENYHFCYRCGTALKSEETICPHCTTAINTRPVPVMPVALSVCQRQVYILLGVFLGFFGVHNFYAKRIGAGLLNLAITFFAFVCFVVQSCAHGRARMFDRFFYNCIRDGNDTQAAVCSHKASYYEGIYGWSVFALIVLIVTALVIILLNLTKVKTDGKGNPMQ